MALAVPPDHSANAELQHALTCAVVVTYADRFALCAQVVRALIAEEVGKIVIVDNASSARSRAALKCLALECGERVELVNLESNAGSAGGYGAGLHLARSYAIFEFVWLLDDDNVPEPGALGELHRTRIELEKVGFDHRLALLSLRDHHPGMKAVARGLSPSLVFPSSSFLGFDIASFFPKVFGRLKLNLFRAQIANSPVTLPFCSYGGMLLSTAVLDQLGYPDERLFVYADDTELTFRLRQLGGLIMLVPTSRVRDIGISWNEVEKAGNGLTRLLLADSDFRVFYSVRNCVFFESRLWARSHFRYLLNRWTFMSIALVASAFLLRTKRMTLIRRAVRDGEGGRLGRTFGDGI